MAIFQSSVLKKFLNQLVAVIKLSKLDEMELFEANKERSQGAEK